MTTCRADQKQQKGDTQRLCGQGAMRVEAHGKDHEGVLSDAANWWFCFHEDVKAYVWSCIICGARAW